MGVSERTHSTASSSCPCGATVLQEDLLTFDAVPASGHFRTCPTESPASASLQFSFCVECGTAALAPGGVAKNYAAIDRATTRQLPGHAHRLVAQLSGWGIEPDSPIVEIGANDGTFLHLLAAAGYQNLFGLEPSESLAHQAARSGLPVLSGYFGPDAVPRLRSEWPAPAAIVCRHTLEHVPDPAEFARALFDYAAASKALLLLEVPDGMAIPELLNVHELWDEHLHYFSAPGLSRLLDRSGFKTMDVAVYPHLDTRNLVVWARPGGGAASQGHLADGEGERCAAAWRSLPSRWGAFTDRFRSRLATAARPFYAIGASHPQCNFLNFVGAPDAITPIDDDPEKVGKFPPLRSAPECVISSARFLATASSGTLLCTGFGYPAWTKALAAHAADMNMQILDPIPLMRASR